MKTELALHPILLFQYLIYGTYISTFLAFLKKWKTKLVQIEKGENQCFMQKANQLTIHSKPKSCHKKPNNSFTWSLWKSSTTYPLGTYDYFLQFSKFFSNSLCAQCDVSEVKNSFIGKNLGKKMEKSTLPHHFLILFSYY